MSRREVRYVLANVAAAALLAAFAVSVTLLALSFAKGGPLWESTAC